jgi:hypothetical protein
MLSSNKMSFQSVEGGFYQIKEVIQQCLGAIGTKTNEKGLFQNSTSAYNN